METLPNNQLQRSSLKSSGNFIHYSSSSPAVLDDIRRGQPGSPEGCAIAVVITVRYIAPRLDHVGTAVKLVRCCSAGNEEFDASGQLVERSSYSFEFESNTSCARRKSEPWRGTVRFTLPTSLPPNFFESSTVVNDTVRDRVFYGQTILDPLKWIGCKHDKISNLSGCE